MDGNLDYITESQEIEGLGELGDALPVSTTFQNNAGATITTSTAQGATAGLSFPPYGPLIGGAIGAFAGVTESIMNAKGAASDVKSAVENAVQSVKNNNDPKVLPSLPAYMSPLIIVAGLGIVGFTAGVIIWKMKKKKVQHGS